MNILNNPFDYKKRESIDIDYDNVPFAANF